MDEAQLQTRTGSRDGAVLEPTSQEQQIIRIQHNGHTTAAAIIASRALAAACKRPINQRGDASWHESS